MAAPRKPKNLKTQVISIRLPAWLVQYLRLHEDSFGKVITKALMSHYALKAPAPSDD